MHLFESTELSIVYYSYRTPKKATPQKGMPFPNITFNKWVQASLKYLDEEVETM